VSRISVVLNWLNLNLSMAGLSWPLYIGGQVSKNRSDSIQITMSVYDIISYFDKDDRVRGDPGGACDQLPTGGDAMQAKHELCILPVPMFAR
jgi:hypothetical protein